MNKYSLTCTCGDVMNVEAASREEAVEKLKGMMNHDAIAAHMAEKHPGEEVTPTEQIHAMIEQNTVAA